MSNVGYNIGCVERKKLLEQYTGISAKEFHKIQPTTRFCKDCGCLLSEFAVYGGMGLVGYIKRCYVCGAVFYSV